jgi:hypothetical protein
MKNLFTLLFVSLLCVSDLFAQDAGDAAYVAGWTAPIFSWWPTLPADVPVRAQATAVQVTSFDAAGCDFDAEWAKIPGAGNVISHQFGNNASAKGGDDFKDAAFKVFFDADNMYILLQYYDDDVTGNETVEIAWAPYLKINAPDIPGLEQAWYTRYTDFGGYKATYKTTGYDAAMMVDGATTGVNWGGTNDILTNNLFFDNHTVTGSHTIKQIYSIGYAALTGPARPDFNPTIWNTLNQGKGISLDMKVNDVDTDDALNTDNPPVKKPAEYWWNATSNDCWALTTYAGFLNNNLNTGIAQTKAAVSIFNKITPDRIEFSKTARVDIFNIIGQPIVSKRGVNQIDLTGLKTGVYIIRANNESMKFVR